MGKKIEKDYKGALHILFYINRSDQDFSIFLYIFLSFEAALTSEVYYMNFQKDEKAHMISDFRKKKISSAGARTHEMRQKVSLCLIKFSEREKNV